jgi:predicted ribosomally synthesized peptide with SipW-like signal peptide
MKRSILLSLLVIGAVAALITAATAADFSDEVTSDGNTFATGTLLLSVDDHCGAGDTTGQRTTGGSPCDADSHVVTVTADGFKPGDTKTWDFSVTNDGTVAGALTTFPTPTYPSLDCDAADFTIGTSNPAAGDNLIAGEATTVTLSVKMKSTAGNECQGVTLTVDVTFDLNQA